MPRRTARAAAAVAVVALLAGAPSAAAALRKAAPVTVTEPVVAVLDTGLRATHQEFDYRGRTATNDQLVGWWDFTDEKKGKIVRPQPGQLWDTEVPEPYDPHGHGTGTAAMAVGHNRVAEKTPSALPGGKLAVGRVLNKTGGLSGDLPSAVRWATDTVRADVINISIGSIVPVPSALQQATYDAIADARRKGILVVVSNGNGYANVGAIPGDPGWASWFSSSPHVLAVGASGANGYLVSTDPEVVAAFSVVTAARQGDSTYVTSAGTSFGAPFVAGFAARLIREARLTGRAVEPGRLEQLIKYVAKDSPSSAPTFEGYGTVSMTELPAAIGHVRAGTLPGRPSPDVSGMYVESVAGTLRSAWSG